MARRRRTADRASLEFRPVIEHYRERLTRPAPPREDLKYPPSTIGPTWALDDDGFWKLPTHTLGWQALGWTGVYLQKGKGDPWVWTDEQARFLLWWYATDPKSGRFVYRDGVLQRLKGWGKDPLGAGLCAIEAFGPCRVESLDPDGHPIGTDNPEAWVQTAATGFEQTKNTMRLFPTLLTDELKKQFGVMVGKEHVSGSGGTRLIQAVTSSPATLEGARASFVLMNETHHWQAGNGGLDMSDVISRNAAKSAGGAARTLRITNAFNPSEESVARQDRELYENVQAGLAVDVGLLYDSLEAPPEAPLDPDEVTEVLKGVRGDSVWLDVDRIKNEVVDGRISPSVNRRFWYNQIVSSDDDWIDHRHLEACRADLEGFGERDEIVMFLDCSKNDDATALIGCRLSDGLVSVLGYWQKPPGDRGKGWLVPRESVDQAVTYAFDTYRVRAFWGDPSHVFDDESQDRYWDALFDKWHRQYGRKLSVWAVRGADGHSIMWDMASPKRVEQFTAAAERVAQEIEETARARFLDPNAEQKFKYDGDGRLTTHFRNAKRYPNRFGTSIWKGHRESKRKIDAAVSAIGARMLRRIVLNDPKRRGGRLY